MSYFPLDREILTSSLWADRPESLKVWLYLLLSADAQGFVRDTLPAIAIRCALTLDEARRVIESFEGSDTESRTKRKGGRRIERTRDGIRILNYVAHRNKDYSTPRWRRWKEKQNQRSTNDPTPLATKGNPKRKREKGKGREEGSCPPPPSDSDLDPSIREALRAAGWGGTPRQLAEEVRGVLASGRTPAEVEAFIRAHPGQDIFGLRRGLVPPVAAESRADKLRREVAESRARDAATGADQTGDDDDEKEGQA